MNFTEFRAEMARLQTVQQGMQEAYAKESNKLIKELIAKHGLDEEVAKDATKLFQAGYVLTYIYEGDTEHVVLSKVIDYCSLSDEQVYNLLDKKSE